MQHKLKTREQCHSAGEKENGGMQKPSCKTWDVIPLLV